MVAITVYVCPTKNTVVIKIETCNTDQLLAIKHREMLYFSLGGKHFIPNTLFSPHTPGPPSWGADTDASTEYPASQTTASGSGSGESTLACESSVTRTVLTSADQRRSLEVISQPISQTLPIISSTPFDMDTAIQPTGYVAIVFHV